MTGIEFTPLEVFSDHRGEVRRGIRKTDSTFHGFSELYFSGINQHVIKGWKKHLEMTSNLIVCSGCIEFAIWDDKTVSNEVEIYSLSPDSNYGRLTIPPGYWMAFHGVGKSNLLCNFSTLIHDPNEITERAYGSINSPLPFKT